MALTATFTANFSSFYDAVAKAEKSVADFGAGADKVGDKLDRLNNSFSGKNIIQQATLMAKAVEDVGGMSALTEKEMARLGSTVSEAVAKMKALGMEVPANLQAIADKTKTANKETEDWAATLGKMAAAAGIVFSVDAVKNFIGSVFSAASAVKDLSDQWGVSTTAVQQFTGAAKASGVESAAVGKSIQFLSGALSENTTEYQALLKNVGLSGKALRELPMEEAYRQVIASIGGVKDETLQLELAIALLGPAAKQMIGPIRDGFLETAAGMEVMTEATITQLEKAQASWESFWQFLVIGTGNALGTVMSLTTRLTSSWDGLGKIFGATFTRMLLSGGQIGDALIAVDESLQRVDESAKGTADAWHVQTTSANELIPKALSYADILKKLKDRQEAATKASKAADEVMKQIATSTETYRKAIQAEQKALDDLAVTFSGRDLIGKALQYLQAIDRSIPIEKMSTEQKAAINKVMLAAIETYERLGEVAPEAMMAVFLATRPAATEADQLRIALMKANAELKAFIDTSGTLPPGLPGSTALPEPPKAPGAGIFDAPSKDLQKNIKEMTDAFQRMADISEGTFGEIAQHVADISAAMNTASASGETFRGGLKAFEKGKTTEGLVGMAAGAMGVVSSFQEATKSTNTLHTTMNGAAIGFSVAGPWGAAVGAAAGLIKGLFNQAKDRKELVLMRDDFVKAAGGVKELAEQAKTAGVRIDNLFLARNTTDFKKAVEELNKAWAEQETNIQTVIDTAAKYGITIEELGPTFKRQELDKQAQALYKDWEVLNASGLDSIRISEGMAGSIQTYVDNAKRMGVEVPEAMRPMLQTMIDNGQLLDENGEAYGTLEEAGLSFTMSLTRGFTLLIASVEKLTDSITKSLTPSIENIPSLPQPTEKQLHGLTQRQIDLWYPQTNIPKYAKGTKGFQDFGSGTMVELHGWEAVVPRDGGAMGTVNASASGGGASGVVVNINAQGAFFDTPDSLQRLASRVSEALTAKYNVMGKLRAAG